MQILWSKNLNMNIYIVLFLIIGTYGQADWTSDLLANIHRLTDNINNNVRHMQQQIQTNVRDHLARIDHLNRDITERVGRITDDVANGSPTIIINGNGGSSRSVISGTLPNGEPYFHDVEERTIGDILHRFESVYNPKTKEMERYHTTLDLNDPKAKPVLVSEQPKAPESEMATAPELVIQQNKSKEG